MQFVELSDKTRTAASFSFVVFCSAILVLDSIIVRVYSSIPREPSALVTLLLFQGIYAFLLISSYIFLRASKQDPPKSNTKTPRLSNVLFRIMIAIQLIICALFGLVAIATAMFGAYDILILSLITYLSLIPSMGYLILLSYLFLHWFRFVRNYSFLLYACAFCLLIVNLAISAVYLNLQIWHYTTIFDPNIEVTSISSAILLDPSPTKDMLLLSTVYDYVAVPIFLLVWIPTAIQLKTYSVSLGNAKFWTLVLIPLLYYFFPLVADEIGVFDKIRLDYGSEFNMVYTVFFGPYKQVGGLLFGIVFWVTSLKVSLKDLQRTLQLSGTGFILLFGSTVMHGVSIITAPPFGFVTLTFAALASFLVMFGLYSSAVLISRDSKLRTEIKRLLVNDTSLLESIGSAHQEFQKKQLIELNKKIQQLVKDTGIEAPLDELEMKDYLNDVLKELRGSKQ